MTGTTQVVDTTTLSATDPPPPKARVIWKAAKFLSYDLNPGKVSTTSAVAGGPSTGVTAGVVVLKADKNNSADVYIGGGGLTTFPLAPSETHALDVPPGFVVDLGEITASGNGTASLIVHVMAVVLSAT